VCPNLISNKFDLFDTEGNDLDMEGTGGLDAEETDNFNSQIKISKNFITEAIQYDHIYRIKECKKDDHQNAIENSSSPSNSLGKYI
jgi:hypothetical protein